MRPLALVVENDDGTRRLLDVLLTRAGFRCDCVANARDALVLIRHVDYDAFFFDLMLSGASGLQLLEVLVATPVALPRVTIISAAPEAQLARVQRDYPDVRIVRKPFDLDELTRLAIQAAAGREPRALGDSDEFCRNSVLAGAKTGVIVQRAGGAVEPVVSFGYPEGFVETFFPIALDQPYPLCDSVRNGRALWLGTRTIATEAFPAAASILEQNKTFAAAVIPLFRDDVVVGAAGWTFREPRRFADGEQRTLHAIAESWSARIPLPGGSPV